MEGVTIPFGASFDPSRRLGFLEIIFEFNGKNSNFLSKDTPEKESTDAITPVKERLMVVKVYELQLRPPHHKIQSSVRPWIMCTASIFSEVSKTTKVFNKIEKQRTKALEEYSCAFSYVEVYMKLKEVLPQIQERDEELTAIEIENNDNDEVKLRKEAEYAHARKMKEEVEMMEQLLESNNEEQRNLRLEAQALKKKHEAELQLRLKTETMVAIERERVRQADHQLEALKYDRDYMRFKADEFARKYYDEVVMRKETEVWLHLERQEIEEMKKELENLNSQVKIWQYKYKLECSLRKDTKMEVVIERERLNKAKLKQKTLEKERDDMHSKAEDFKIKYNKEVVVRKELENSWDLEMIEWEQRFETMAKIQETQAKTLQEIDNAIKAAAKEIQAPSTPPSFFCPITQEIMNDPHLAADGFTYEAEAIKKWLNTGRKTSPMTNLKLSHLNLVPNRTLRSAIQELVTIMSTF